MTPWRKTSRVALSPPAPLRGQKPLPPCRLDAVLHRSRPSLRGLKPGLVKRGDGASAEGPEVDAERSDLTWDPGDAEEQASLAEGVVFV